MHISKKSRTFAPDFKNNHKTMAKNERNAGRKRMEGERHMYTVASDAHAYIMKHGGGQWLTDIVRVIIAANTKEGY